MGWKRRSENNNGDARSIVDAGAWIILAVLVVPIMWLTGQVARRRQKAILLTVVEVFAVLYLICGLLIWRLEKTPETSDNTKTPTYNYDAAYSD